MAINVGTLNALLTLEDRDFGKILDRAMAGLRALSKEKPRPSLLPPRR